MRLNCNVISEDLNIVNRAKVVKPSKAVISVGFHGPKEKSVALLLIATALEKVGQKYPIRDNVENIFGKFVSQGKCTVRLKEPRKDIMISDADPVQLKTFLQIICSVLKTGTAPELTVLKPIEKNEIEPKKTRMLIRNRNEYPLNKSFPITLKVLILESACQLKRIDSRIFQLSNLTVLSLSNQQLVTIPASIFGMSLKELILNGNKLESFPEWSPYSSQKLLTSLTRLDLSANSLKAFPESLLKMRNLYHLNISTNRIPSLPNFCGFSNLKELRAANNLLEVLNFSTLDFNKKFNILDVFGNPFRGIALDRGRRLNEQRFEVCKSLFILSANKLCNIMKGANFDNLSEDLPQTVINLLNKCERCVCSGFTVRGKVMTLDVDLYAFCATVTSVDTNGRTTIPVQFKLCSAYCEMMLSRRILT